MSNLVHISLSPNLEREDLLLAAKSLVAPSNKKTNLAKALKSMFTDSEVFLTMSGRTALSLALHSLNFPKDSVVLLQSFTCSALVNPILDNGLIPRYLDIEHETFNLDFDQLHHKKVLREAKALIVQHTFGTPHPQLMQIKEFCKQNNIVLIEDCAHSLGAKVENKHVGQIGDLAILSFGRDKVISSVFGGALLVNNMKMLSAIETKYSSYPFPSQIWIKQQLLHPLISFISRATYTAQIGKGILAIAQKANIISKAIYPSERNHVTPRFFNAKMSEELEVLAEKQFAKLKRFNDHRRAIARIYHDNINNNEIRKPTWNDNSIYLRYNILSPMRDSLVRKLKRENIIVGDWYSQPVTPSSNLSKANYKKGSCPNTEFANKHSINLPTHPLMSVEDAYRIVAIVNE